MDTPACPSRARRRALLSGVLRLVVPLLLLGTVAVPTSAQAYPWMIRHHYANCGSCHADPSGAGLLTQYGRAQSELLLATRWRAASEEEEVSPSTGFLFGAVPLPEWLNLSFDLRGGAVATRSGETTSVRPVQMVTDLRGHAAFGQLQAYASVGFVWRRALATALTPWPENNVVSREHWLGVDVADQTVLLRAGRIPLPFGLRNVEHVTWVRATTRSDINEHQQHGLAVAYNVEGIRAELMGFVGNLQLQPDYYRERGYSGYFELALPPNAAVGISSMMAQARYDVGTREPFFLRQAHGLFGRWAPAHPVVLMAEVNALHDHPQGGEGRPGLVGLLQADVMPLQGLHLIATGELLTQPTLRGVAGWASVAWFVNPHAEVRVDTILRRLATGGPTSDTLTIIGQLHLNL